METLSDLYGYPKSLTPIHWAGSPVSDPVWKLKSKLISQRRLKIKILKKVVFLICNGFDMRGLLFHRACKIVSFSAFPLFHKSSFRDINETSSSVPVTQQTQARQRRLDMCQNREKSNLSFSLSICFCTRSAPSFPPSLPPNLSYPHFD